jgi:hypothetical protein
MYKRLDRTHRSIPVVLGVAALAGAVALFAWDSFPKLFSAGIHNGIAAFSLAAIGFAYLVYQGSLQPSLWDRIKAILLAFAFFFWAANQLWSTWPQAVLFNDIAVALFVLDLFLVMLGWPPASAERAFAEFPSRDGREPCNPVAGPDGDAHPQAARPDRQPQQRLTIRPNSPVYDRRQRPEPLAEEESR